TVDIEPMVIAPIPVGSDEDDGDEDAPLPVLMNVPVMFPRAGGVEITMPVQAGDTMLILFTDWDLGRWRASGEKRRPITTAKHGISGAVAVPGLYPSSAAGAGFSVALTASAMEVDGNSDAAAKASTVDQNFNAVKVALDALATAIPTTHTYVPTGVASSKLKLGG